MENKVREIIAFLIEHILDKDRDGGETGEDRAILDTLLAKGYTLPEIAMAFALIFTPEEKIEPANQPVPRDDLAARRVFTDLERVKVRLDARSLLIQLAQEGLIGALEMEEIMLEASMMQVVEVGVMELKSILQKVIVDEPRALFLTSMPQFSSLLERVSAVNN